MNSKKPKSTFLPPVRVSPALRKKIVAAAKSDSRSLSDFIRLALVQVIEGEVK